MVDGSSNETRVQDDEWWKCPNCGENTYIMKYEDGGAERSCTNCEWSKIIPAIETDGTATSEYTLFEV